MYTEILCLQFRFERTSYHYLLAYRYTNEWQALIFSFVRCDFLLSILSHIVQVIEGLRKCIMLQAISLFAIKVILRGVTYNFKFISQLMKICAIFLITDCVEFVSYFSCISEQFFVSKQCQFQTTDNSDWGKNFARFLQVYKKLRMMREDSLELTRSHLTIESTILHVVCLN